MVLAAPELVVAQFVQMLDEFDVPAELQHRMFADGMMRGEKGAEAEPMHKKNLPERPFIRLTCPTGVVDRGR
jgi:hypothetical protein